MLKNNTLFYILILTRSDLFKVRNLLKSVSSSSGLTGNFNLYVDWANFWEVNSPIVDTVAPCFTQIIKGCTIFF